MNPETNANNLQNDDLNSDSKTGFSSKRMRKLQVKRSKVSIDEKMEVDDENQNAETNVNSEEKNGVDNESKVTDDDGNQNEDAKDGKGKGSKTSHIQNCVSKELSSNGVDCEKKLEEDKNLDLQVCNNDAAKQLDDKLITKVKEKSSANKMENLNQNENSPNASEGTSVEKLVNEKQSDSDTTSTSMATGNVNVPKETNSVNKEKDLNENTDKNNVDSSKDIRPTEKMLGMSPETIVSDVGLLDKDNGKNDSSSSKSKSDKEKEMDSEVSLKDAGQAKTNVKGKENDASPHVSKTESAKKEEPVSKKKKSKICEECGAKKGLKFQVHYQGKTRFLCSDACFKNFKVKQEAGKTTQESSKTAQESPKTPTPAPVVRPSADKCAQCHKEIPSGQGYFPVVGETKTLCSEECIKKYHENNVMPKKCSQCKKCIEDPRNVELLTWETMVFCNEDCLGKYQSFLGSHCTCCQSPVQQSSLGKYCVCFGADIRQFCSGSCLEEFKKGLKVCSFCQTDLSAGIDGFLAPVGDKGQFKDFCSPQCMERYEVMNNISKNAPPMQECSHCKKQGTFKIQAKHENKTYSLCCDLCVAGFRCSNKIKDHMCDTCYKFFSLNLEDEFSLKLDGMHKHFCTKACMTLFVLSHRKIVPCVWCKVKKYNFDMIEKSDINNQTQVFCSLNCLSLYRVSLNAASSKSIRCDNCSKNLPAQYHLTMSDGSIRNFCNYQCVLHFQNQFTNVPALTTTTTTRQISTTVAAASKTTAATSTPVISNVISLAPARSVAPTLVNKLVPQKLVTARQPGPSIAVITSKSQISSSTITSPSVSSTASTSTGGQPVVREVIVKPPPPKSVKNKTVSCKPIMQSKGVSCKPHPCHKAVQTDDSPRPIILPIPVPIYVPTPLHMFSRPVPCPVPFPVPIPVPIIVPTAKDSPSQVIKHLKDIQEKIPSNPYEAELLMMAEMVAEDGGKDQRAGKDAGQSKVKESFHEKIEELPTRNAVQTTASEVVIEPKLPASSVPPPVSFDHPSTSVEQASTSYDHSSKSYVEEQNVADVESEADDEYVFKDSKSHHRRHHHHGKRSGSHGKSKGRKKMRSDEPPLEEVDSHTQSINDEQASTSYQNDQQQISAPLKGLTGLNAWKFWVQEKNKQMEKGSHSTRKFKRFKTDLLQLPPDELNYSLSLFVKEVRKPCGDEYTSGALYYLCLSIQLYLFENGRIDNIFTDPYYEKFTECLNDALQSQDALFHMEGLPCLRVDEEVLWDAKQLGAHSPPVLLNTLMYFNTKYFKLRTVEDHARLSFSHVTKIWQKTARKGIHNALLRYYPPNYKGNEQNEKNVGGRQNKFISEYIDFVRRHRDETLSYEQKENEIDPFKCPVKLFEFYISKCPESMKVRNDSFYLYPERSCVPDSPVWYASQAISTDMMAKMIHRIRIVRQAFET